MSCPRDDLGLDGVPLVRLESELLRVDVAPSIGGRIVSVVHKPTALTCRRSGEKLILSGELPRFGLHYERGMWLREDGPQLELAYRIANRTSQPRSFLWKLHAALAIQAGDVIHCPARRGQVVDLAWSRYRTLGRSGAMRSRLRRSGCPP